MQSGNASLDWGLRGHPNLLDGVLVLLTFGRGRLVTRAGVNSKWKGMETSQDPHSAIPQLIHQGNARQLPRGDLLGQSLDPRPDPLRSIVRNVRGVSITMKISIVRMTGRAGRGKRLQDPVRDGRQQGQGSRNLEPLERYQVPVPPLSPCRSRIESYDRGRQGSNYASRMGGPRSSSHQLSLSEVTVSDRHEILGDHGVWNGSWSRWGYYSDPQMGWVVLVDDEDYVDVEPSIGREVLDPPSRTSRIMACESLYRSRGSW